MSSVKRGTWCFIVFLGVVSLLSCDFKTQLTYFHVLIDLSILTLLYFAFAHPPEELLDGLGITLYDLFGLLFQQEHYSFIEYMCVRQIFFKVYVAAYPVVLSAYFVHGNFFTSNTAVSRFPDLLNMPMIWNTLFVCLLGAVIMYYFKFRDYKKWSFYQYFIDNPECAEQIEQLVQEPDTFKIRFSQHAFLYCTRTHFVYVSNWRFVAVRQSDLRLQVDATRMPMIPPNADEERLRHIYVKVSFRQAYLDTFSISLRHDLYRQLNEILEIPIIVPPHITIPLTIMEELKEDFIARVEQNDIYRHQIKSADREPCFACGTDDNIVKIVKTCADNNERWQWTLEGQRVYTDRCQPCVCRPLWCHRCIAQIFITKQNIEDLYRHDYWRGTSQCPTCRKAFCIRDVHLVEFIIDED